jgi:hypothetical protein
VGITSELDLRVDDADLHGLKSVAAHRGGDVGLVA